MIIGIDHVIVAVEELDKAMDAWRTLGFQVLRGGEHPQYGTHNALVPLADGFYFELMAIKDPTLVDQFPVTRRLHEVLSSNNRFLGFALDSDDLGGDVNAVRERGLTVFKAPPGGRVRPDGVHVGWRTAHAEDSRLPLLIQDETPRDLRIPAPTDGIGRDLRVKWVEVAAEDPGSLRDHYAKLIGEGRADEFGPLKRGGVRVAKIPSADGIETVILAAGNLDSVAHGWEMARHPFTKEAHASYGTVLMLANFRGVRLGITKG